MVVKMKLLSAANSKNGSRFIMLFSLAGVAYAQETYGHHVKISEAFIMTVASG